MTTGGGTVEEFTACPVCSAKSLGKHCDSHTCGWHRCRNKACGSVLDLSAGHGMRPKGTNWEPLTLGG